MDAIAQPITPPAPAVLAKPFPAWRHILEMSRNTLAVWPVEAFEAPFARAQVLGIESVLINDPEGIRHVLATGAANYLRPILAVRAIRPLTGAGVLLSEGAQWRRQRKTLAPVFSPTSVKMLLPHFMLAAERLAGTLEGHTSANLSTAFHAATLEAVLRALFSLPPEGGHSGMAAMARDYVTGPGRPNLLDALAKREDDFPFAAGRRRRFQERWFDAVDAVIADRRREAGSAVHEDLLGQLLSVRDPETGEALPDAEIRDQCATMLLAGFETTSRLLFWASYLLALDPMEQVAIRREIQAFPPERIGDLDDLQHWPRLRQALLETLRLYPSAPHVVREAVGEDEVMGEVIHAKTQVWISPWVIHRHRKFWEHPTAFVPGRFAGKASPWTSFGPFIPFGAGPRICIGASFALAEAQIVLATLLSRFEIGLDSRRPVLPVGGVTVGPDHDPSFRLTPAS